jgi:hypothetical protein
MIVTFEDADGETGRVTDDLDVEYDGQWEEQVRDHVADVEERYRNGDELLGEDALSTLVTELPEAPLVVAAERKHG